MPTFHCSQLGARTLQSIYDIKCLYIQYVWRDRSTRLGLCHFPWFSRIFPWFLRVLWRIGIIELISPPWPVNQCACGESL